MISAYAHRNTFKYSIKKVTKPYHKAFLPNTNSTQKLFLAFEGCNKQAGRAVLLGSKQSFRRHVIKWRQMMEILFGNEVVYLAVNNSENIGAICTSF